MESYQKLMIRIVVLALAAFPYFLQGAETGGTISGVITNTSGEPVAGAMIKARQTDLKMTVAVFSQEQGRYQAPNLPAGHYRVEALGGGYQSGSPSEVEVRDGQTARVNLALTDQRNLMEAMTSSDLAATMPEGEGKEIMLGLCTVCHHRGLQNPLSKRFTRDGWMEIVQKMRSNPFGYNRSLDITDAYRDIVVDYLAKNYGPETPFPDKERDLPRRWVRGPATKAVITEYEIPRGAEPHDVGVDSKGVAWVGEEGSGILGRLDPRSHTYTRISLPEVKSVGAPTVDVQDRIWVSDGRNNRLLRYDPKNQTFDFFPLKKSAQERGGGAHDIRFTPDGILWATDLSGRILRLDPATKEFTAYPVHSSSPSKMSPRPYGMAIDGNQIVWFAENGVDRMGRLDPQTGKITEHDLPTRLANPRRMGTDAEGNAWIGEYGNVGKLAKIDYRTGQITEYPTPTKYSGAYSVDVDRTHNLIWLCETMAEQLARFDPRTNTFVEYPLPTPFGSIRRIEVDRSRPNRVWFSGNYSDKVGYLDVVE